MLRFIDCICPHVSHASLSRHQYTNHISLVKLYRSCHCITEAHSRAKHPDLRYDWDAANLRAPDRNVTFIPHGARSDKPEVEEVVSYTWTWCVFVYLCRVLVYFPTWAVRSHYRKPMFLRHHITLYCNRNNSNIILESNVICQSLFVVSLLLVVNTVQVNKDFKTHLTEATSPILNWRDQKPFLKGLTDRNACFLHPLLGMTDLVTTLPLMGITSLVTTFLYWSWRV